VSTTADSSGHGLTGIVRYASDVPGRFGRAFGFLNAGSVVRVTQSPLLEPAAVTVLAWVRAAADPGNYANIAAKGADTVCGRASWALYTGRPGAPGLRFYVDNGSPSVVLSPSGGTALWDGQWHLVAGTYDGAAARLYVDGQQMGAGTPTIGAINYALPIGDFDIGNFPGYTSCNGLSTWFPGEIDEARVYSRALSGTEIGRLAAATGPDPPALIADPPGSAGGGGSGGGSGGTGGGGSGGTGGGGTDQTGGGGGAEALPTVAFVTRPSSPTLQRMAWLSGLGSTAGAADAKITKYEWDLNGDGTYDVGCGGEAPNVSYAVKKAGDYDVTLRVTNSLGQSAVSTQAVSVPKSSINKARLTVTTCEQPLGGDQADKPGCVKTFAFSIVQVNSRGAPDECFEITSRSALTGLANGSQVSQDFNNVRYYHAKIAGFISVNGVPILVPQHRQTEYDSGEGSVSIGSFPILIPLPGRNPAQLGTVPLDFKIEPTKGRFDLPPLKGSTSFDVTGLKFGGGVNIALLQGFKSEVKISIVLPDIFDFGFKREAQGFIVLHGTNADGFDFEGARISQIPQVFIGPLLVNDLFFEYQRTGAIWRGGANFQIAAVSPVQIKAAPPPPEYGFGLRGGRFDYAGGAVAFPLPPRPQIFPGVGLTEIGGSIGIDPIRFTGRIGIDVGGFIVLDGSAFIGLASQDKPYNFPQEFAPPGLGFLSGRTLDSVSIAVGGDAIIRVPVAGDLPLLNSYVFYAYPDYVEFGGAFKFSVADRFSVEGNIGGFGAVLQRKFNLEGRVQGCVDIEITKFCVQVGAVVSSKGIAFCTIVPIPVPFDGTVATPAGIGYTWDGGIDIKVFSCDIGPYSEARPRAHVAQATRTFRLQPGLPSAMVKVVGSGAPPSVELTGPHGEHIVAPQDDPNLVRQDVVVIPQTPQSTTLIAVKKPSGGNWTITPRPGSAPIRSVATADGLPDPKVHATVSGSGERRLLTYKIEPAAGQKVMFFERGARSYRELGAAAGDSGSIRFAPAPGRRGRREIVAMIQRGGITTTSLTVAHYDAAGTERPARPAGLAVIRTGTGLRVRWRRAQGAVSYAVTLRLSNGSELFKVTRNTRVSFGDLGRLASGRVTVRGLRADNTAGRPASHAVAPRRSRP
jgi:hypothetical protein